MNEAEEWRPIPGYEGLYEVSNMGRVRTLRRRDQFPDGRIMSPSMVGRKNLQYPHVILSKDGVQKGERVHRLVLKAFVGPCPDGHEGAHLDGNSTDARLSNLAWVTKLENNRHRIQHGTQIHGSTHHLSSLTEELAAEIYALRGTMGSPACAKKYGVAKATIERVWDGTTWWRATQHREREPFVASSSRVKRGNKCINGHDYAEHGNFSANQWVCRVCNAAAQKRRREKMKAVANAIEDPQ